MDPYLDNLLSLLTSRQTVAFTLEFMLAYSIGIMLERSYRCFRARSQSRKFIKQSAFALRDQQIDETLLLANRHLQSHVAIVVASGLAQFTAVVNRLPRAAAVDVVTRALRCTTSVLHRDMKDGLSDLATIASTAPLVGLLGTVIGIFGASAVSP